MIDTPITLDQLELYYLDLPQKTTFQSGIGIRKSKETLIVKWVDGDGNVGFGECSCRPDPYFSAEFLSASKDLIQKFIAPQLGGEQTYSSALNSLGRIRGWNFTKSAVESAMFQIVKQTNPEFQLSNHLVSKAKTKVPVGISLGIYNDEKEFKEVVEQAIKDGYHRLKFKIAPFVDLKMFEAINPILFDANVQISFDANGSFNHSNMDHLSYFINTYKTTIEQPTPPRRLDILMAAKEKFPNLKVCFDEEVESIGDLILLKSLNLVDELNLKIGRVGGISNSIQILNYCIENDIPCWMGGMFETGIGRLQNLEVASFMTQVKAHDLSPSSRYFKEDIITPEIEMDDGYIVVEKAMKSKVIQEKIDQYTIEKIKIKY